MPDVPADTDWSPADHPYAIAVSEALWWRCAAQLAFARLGDADDGRSAPVSSRQVDARNLIFALAQLLAAERLEQGALRDLQVGAGIGGTLSEARDRYLAAIPGIQEIRNALTHFDEWAIGRGHGPQHADTAGGAKSRDVAAAYWAFGYYPSEKTVKLGPYEISVPAAVRAAFDLARAIETAAREVDRTNRRPADDRPPDAAK